MIIDHIDNAGLYYHLGTGIEAGLRFLCGGGLERLPAGRHEIKGDALYAMVSEYKTRLRAQARWEAHRRYIDIQYIASGVEAIGYQCVSNLEVETPYSGENDALFLKGAGSRLIVAPKFFAIFFPQDAHQPGLSVLRPQMVRKIVVKVRAN
jgi:YhcH/YjgK/YiaL family protein